MNETSYAAKSASGLTFRGFLALDEYDQGRLAQLLFFIPFGVWLSMRILYSYTWLGDIICPIITMATVRFVCYCTLAIRELLFGRWDKTAVLGFSITLVMAAIANGANYTGLVEVAFFVFAARNMDFQRVARFAFVVMCATYAVVLACCALGISPDVVYNEEYRTRHTLGFTYPNSACAVPFYLLCLWVFLRGEKLRIADFVIGFGLLAGVFALTVSRSAFLASTVLVVLAAFCRFAPPRLFQARSVKMLGVWSVTIVALGSVLLVLAYDPSNSVMVSLDSLASGRLRLAHNMIAEYGIPLLGQAKSFGGASYIALDGTLVQGDEVNLIDCVYPKLLVHCGLVYFVVAIALATAVARKASLAGQKYLLVILFAIAVHGVFEPFAAYLHFDAFLFLIGMLFASGPASDSIANRVIARIRAGQAPGA